MSRDVKTLVIEKCVSEPERSQCMSEPTGNAVPVKEDNPLMANAARERRAAKQKFNESRDWLRSIFGAAPGSGLTAKPAGKSVPPASRGKLTNPEISERCELLHAIFDASQDGFLVEDGGRIVFTNKAFAQMLGYSAPEELFDTDSADILAPDEIAHFREIGEVRRRGDSMPPIYEFTGKRKNGTLIDLEASVSVSVIGGKTLTITAVRDLTTRKRADCLIKASEERFRLLGEKILHQVWTADAGGTVDYINARTLEYSGLTERQALQKVWQDDVHPDDVAVCAERWEKSLATGAYYEAEFRMRDAGGVYRWHLGRATAERGADNKIKRWFGTNTDINDQKMAEESLRKSEERFQLVARATNDVLWDWDILTDEIWVNESIQTVFGYALDRVENRLELWRNGIHAEDNQRIQQNIYQFLDGDEQVWTGEYRYARHDGTYAVVFDRRILLRGEHGEPLRMLGSMQDITERRQAEQSLLESEERLRQSQKMEAIGTLTGGVAHDFNNLLTAILVNSQLALRRLAPDDAVHRHLIEIQSAGKRAAELTAQLLAFSRRQHLERKVINLNDSICDITKMLQRIIGADIEVSVKCAGQLATVFADAAQIEQVVMNLAVNARDAMPNGGKLVIETRNVELDKTYCRQYPYAQPGRYVQIRVSDNGCGMDEATQARVFEPFFTTKEVGKGTGLGLSMAYGIVKQHDGHINVCSAVGSGTSFKVYLPVNEKIVEAEQPAAQTVTFGGSETILVAEDEENLGKLAKDVLEASGYTVLLARNGEEAFKIYRENRERVDLLLLDVVMPQMGGTEVYEQICAAGGDVPVIFMTGYSTETVQNRFVKQSELFAGGQTTIVQKPYSVELIHRKIREVLNERSKSV